MTAIPGLRLDGPPAQRDATVLLAVATFLVAARLPMGFLALLVLPAGVVVVQGINRRARMPRVLTWLFGTGLVASLLSVALYAPQLAVTTNNNLAILLAALLCAVAVFHTGARDRAASRLFDGIYAGLLFSWALSIFEAASGFKFLPRMYPGANTAAAVQANRIFVTALFPNFNDYSVAMAILVTCVLSRLVFDPRATRGRLALRWFVVLTSTFFIVHMGSRGALAALLLGLVAVVLLSVRVLHPTAFSPRVVCAGTLLVVAAVLGTVTSPYVQDHSTAMRGVIAGNIGQMLMADPIHALIGYPSTVTYQQAAAARFGPILMDPHNLLLEMVVWYGVPMLACYLVAWWTVTRWGVFGLRRNPGWKAVAAFVVTALYPLLGIVTSSTLRYHLVWPWLLVAMANLCRLREQRTAPAAGSPGRVAPRPAVAES